MLVVALLFQPSKGSLTCHQSPAKHDAADPEAAKECSPSRDGRLDAAEMGMAAGADEWRQGRYQGGRRPVVPGCVIRVGNLSAFACFANSDVPGPWDHGKTPE